jgi:hypothetical protein
VRTALDEAAHLLVVVDVAVRYGQRTLWADARGLSKKKRNQLRRQPYGLTRMGMVLSVVVERRVKSTGGNVRQRGRLCVGGGHHTWGKCGAGRVATKTTRVSGGE